MAKKIKIREIPSKIKEISEDEDEESDLEEDIEQEATRQFEEFMILDTIPAPIIDSGQEPVERVIEREPIPITPQTNQPEETGNLYDIGRGLGEERRLEYNPSNMNESLEAIPRRQLGRDFAIESNQLARRQTTEDRLKAEDKINENKYDSREKKKSGRYAWER